MDIIEIGIEIIIHTTPYICNNSMFQIAGRRKKNEKIG